jgi:hypothetical protein
MVVGDPWNPITINGVNVNLNRYMLFSREISLREGQNIIEIAAENTAGEDIKTIVVNYAPRGNGGNGPDDPNDITGAFTDPNFLKVIRDIVGKPIGPIYKSDAEKIDILYVSGWPNQIASLNGIEYLANLRVLEVRNTNITALDLSVNTALQDVIIEQNQRLATLDVSGCVSLVKLLAHFNALTSLTLPETDALIELWVHMNNLTSIDVSENPGLRLIRCDDELNIIGLDETQTSVIIR